MAVAMVSHEVPVQSLGQDSMCSGPFILKENKWSMVAFALNPNLLPLVPQLGKLR